MAETADGSYDADDGLVGEGPKSDEEMPLADHIEEMVYRLGIVLVVMAIIFRSVSGLSTSCGTPFSPAEISPARECIIPSGSSSHG